MTKAGNLAEKSAPTSLLPSVSVVIEWENVKLSEQDRAFAMLRSLSQQARALTPRFARPPELILLYDRDEIEAAQVENAIAREIAPDSGLIIRLEPVSGLEYYSQKNRGAALASNDIIAFLDSDVVPEGDWMEALVSVMKANPGCVIGGNTYLDPSTFIGRCFGAFWFFGPRQGNDDLVPVERFLANSVAFPRELFAQYNFPAVEAMRGQCAALADRLMAAGIPIYICNSVRASHPAPNGLVHFIRRALSEGHDERAKDIHLRKLNRPRSAIWGSLQRMGANFWRAGKRLIKRRSAVNMPLYEAPVALGVAGMYYTLFALGDMISAIDEELIPRRFGV